MLSGIIPTTRSNVMYLCISAVALALHVTSQAVQATVAVHWIVVTGVNPAEARLPRRGRMQHTPETLRGSPGAPPARAGLAPPACAGTRVCEGRHERIKSSWLDPGLYIDMLE